MSLDLVPVRKQINRAIHHLPDELRILETELLRNRVDGLLLAWREFDVEIAAGLALLVTGLVIDVDGVYGVGAEKGLLIIIGHFVAPTALSCYESVNGWFRCLAGILLIEGIGSDPAESLGGGPGFLSFCLLLLLCLWEKLFDFHSQLSSHLLLDNAVFSYSTDRLINHGRWLSVHELLNPDLIQLQHRPPYGRWMKAKLFEALECFLISPIYRFASAQPFSKKRFHFIRSCVKICILGSVF